MSPNTIHHHQHHHLCPKDFKRSTTNFIITIKSIYRLIDQRVHRNKGERTKNEQQLQQNQQRSDWIGNLIAVFVIVIYNIDWKHILNNGEHFLSSRHWDWNRNKTAFEYRNKFVSGKYNTHRERSNSCFNKLLSEIQAALFTNYNEPSWRYVKYTFVLVVFSFLFRVLVLKKKKIVKFCNRANFENNVCSSGWKKLRIA